MVCVFSCPQEYQIQQRDMETLLEGISAAEDAERVAKEEALNNVKRHEAQVAGLEKRFACRVDCRKFDPIQHAHFHCKPQDHM